MYVQTETIELCNSNLMKYEIRLALLSNHLWQINVRLFEAKNCVSKFDYQFSFDVHCSVLLIFTLLLQTFVEEICRKTILSYWGMRRRRQINITGHFEKYDGQNLEIGQIWLSWGTCFGGGSSWFWWSGQLYNF